MTDQLDPKFSAVLRDVISKVSPKDLELSFKANDSIKELGLDSVSLAEVVVMLEDEFKVSLELKQIEEIETFGQLQELLQPST
jgi:acyl carrier protein